MAGWNVITEALVVGLSNALMGSVVSLAFMYMSSPDFELKNYHFWHYVALSFFVTGVLLHAFFETTGLNALYVLHSHATSVVKKNIENSLRATTPFAP